MQRNPHVRPVSFLTGAFTCCIVFPFLISCEPRDEKVSRIAIETYSQMINSALANVAETKAEEGFTDLSPEDHYSPTLARINEIDSGLNGFRFSQGYLPFGRMQHSIAAELNNYVKIRIRTALSMRDALNGMVVNPGDFKNSFPGNIEIMDSVSVRLDSLINDYNLKANGSRLKERIVLPPMFTDTVNDFLLNNRSHILNLKAGT